MKGSSATNPLLTLDANNNTFTISTPSWLKQKGRCLVRVIGGFIQITKTGSAAADADSIVPVSTGVIYLESNIPFIGYDAQNNGAMGAILGSCNGDRTIATQGLSQGLNQSGDNIEFVCPNLPDQISITKYYYAANGDPTRANTGGNDLVPCSVTLQIEFMEDNHWDTRLEQRSARF